MNRTIPLTLGIILTMAIMAANAYSWGKFKTLKHEDGVLKIPVADISDGMAHYFKVAADDGIMVHFFVLKSSDGVIRAAIDACDVCFRSGKGYFQEGDVMVCTNCGRRFASNRINEVKGGCNPAPLNRKIVGQNLIVSMADINQNSWYCKFK